MKALRWRLHTAAKQTIENGTEQINVDKIFCAFQLFVRFFGSNRAVLQHFLWPTSSRLHNPKWKRP